MRFLRVRLAVAVVVFAGALLAPSAASAGPLYDVFSPFFHTQYGTYSYDGQTGPPHVFAFVGSTLDDQANSQALVGTFDTGAFVGTLFLHTYDRATDTGHYTLKGTIDPTGIAPPVPILADVTVHIDRVQAVAEITLDGTIAGQPFFGTTGPVVNPLYGL
jgi:hypothetical protein